MQQKAIRYLSVLLYGGVTVGVIWILVKFLLPWTAPFLVALAAAALLEAPVKRLCAHGWSRPAAAAVLSIAMLGLLILGAVLLTSRGIGAVTSLARQIPELMEGAEATIRQLRFRASEFIRTAPDGLSDYLETALDVVSQTVYNLPLRLSRWVLDAAAKAAQSSPGILLFLITAGIGLYFCSASFPRIIAFLRAQLPISFRERLQGLDGDLKNSFGGFLRAQLFLILITFFELTAAFFLLRVPNAFLVAAITALIDALPVFGVGIVLLPWAAYSVLLGDLRRGIGLVIVWGVVTLVRNCAQAKLLGDQIGLDPLVSLLSVYMGWRIWGVWGMLLFPILFVTLRQLNDKGVIKLWKNI